MGELVGVRALAREFGVSHSAVIKAVKECRLTPAAVERDGPKFDVEAARAEWRPSVPTTTDDDECGDDDDNARYRKARADKEEAVAEQEKLKLAQLRRELLPASEVVMYWTNLIQAFGDKSRGVAPKVFSRFPGLTEEGRDFLTEELRTMTDDLSVWSPNDGGDK